MIDSFESILTVQASDADALSQATRVIRRFSDQKLSLADAHGLPLMERHGLQLCWSTDWHMGLIGATLAIH